MALRITRVRIVVCIQLIAIVRCLQPMAAFAHAAPAYPPEFEPGPCVLVVDKDEQPIVKLGYRVPVDDTQLTLGDITLPDALTHQFFAFRGSVLFEGFMPELRTFEKDDPSAVVFPLWISPNDVARAQASSDKDMLGYDLSAIGEQQMLETQDELVGRWERVTGDDHRVPITGDQALSGLQWNVRVVEPGLYTVAGYIFSPPYNGWEIRSGLVSIVDHDRHPPAAVVSRVQESLFEGQGRRVRTCLYAPEGTRMRSSMMVQEREDLGWMAWGEEMSVESGMVEQCFLPPQGLTGSVRMRVELIAPDGSVAVFYSPDVVTMIPGSLPCTESDSICCEAPATRDAGPGRDVDASTIADAGANAGAASEHDEKDGGGGCAVGLEPRRRGLLELSCVVLALVLSSRKRARVVPARPRYTSRADLTRPATLFVPKQAESRIELADFRGRERCDLPRGVALFDPGGAVE
jgi:hypothetical protein